MISTFLIGGAIILGFLVLWLTGFLILSQFLDTRFGQDEERKTWWWRVGIASWMIVLAGLFALVAGTEWGRPVAKLTPLVVIGGI